MSFVEIADFDTAIEADMAWMLLDGAGIPAKLLDNHMARIRSDFGMTGIQRARLLVPEEYADQARALLAADQAEVMEPLPEEATVSPEDFGPAPSDEENCPACGASHTEYVSRSLSPSLFLGFLGWLLTALPIPVKGLPKNMRCQGCGHEWKLGG